jgi:hypothetical protein
MGARLEPLDQTQPSLRRACGLCRLNILVDFCESLPIVRRARQGHEIEVVKTPWSGGVISFGVRGDFG